MSDKTTHICVVDTDGRVLRRDVVASDPDALGSYCRGTNLVLDPETSTPYRPAAIMKARTQRPTRPSDDLEDNDSDSPVLGVMNRDIPDITTYPPIAPIATFGSTGVANIADFPGKKLLRQNPPSIQVPTEKPS